MKKKLLAVFTAVCTLIALCGCVNFGSEEVTDAYRKMNKIYLASREGEAYTKEDIKALLGNPGYYNDPESEETKIVRYTNGEITGEEELIFGYKVTYWRYDCNKLLSGSKPYMLEITFDKNGNATFIDFNFINEGKEEEK